jgi:transposase
MQLPPMHKRAMALDVHQAKISACAIVEHDDGRVEVTMREFGAFKRDRRALAQWALEIRPEVVVMESTGVYWKSPFAALTLPSFDVVHSHSVTRLSLPGPRASLLRTSSG